MKQNPAPIKCEKHGTRGPCYSASEAPAHTRGPFTPNVVILGPDSLRDATVSRNPLVLVVPTDLGEKRSIPSEKPPVTVTIRYSHDAVEVPAATGSALLPGGSRVPASFGGGGEESEHHAACE
ncbi:hypothetical protein EYF80_058949 [Liparis tanakae]|uniref:Uncharacterized protein n=1 Tax=Liparis tanakae TaxID=230148 RepID=A0A4Z2EQ21_9TELE|nr:hypothetical protein EYF80_058949 [Liparis tanakae]